MAPVFVAMVQLSDASPGNRVWAGLPCICLTKVVCGLESHEMALMASACKDWRNEVVHAVTRLEPKTTQVGRLPRIRPMFDLTCVPRSSCQPSNCKISRVPANSNLIAVMLSYRGCVLLANARGSTSCPLSALCTQLRVRVWGRTFVQKL